MSALKLKELHDRSRGMTFLQLSTNKRLTLNYQKAQLLAKNERSYFVPFSFLEKGDERRSKADLYFFTDELVPVLDYLSWGVSSRRLGSMISQIVRMFTLCESRGFFASNILLDIDYCYVFTQSALLKFIYLPVNGYASEDRALREFLLAFTEAVKPKEAQAANYQLRLLDFLRRMDVFSLFSLKEYITSLEGGQAVYGNQVKKKDKPRFAPAGAAQVGTADSTHYRDFVQEVTGGLGAANSSGHGHGHGSTGHAGHGHGHGSHGSHGHTGPRGGALA